MYYYCSKKLNLILIIKTLALIFIIVNDFLAKFHSEFLLKCSPIKDRNFDFSTIRVINSIIYPFAARRFFVGCRWPWDDEGSILQRLYNPLR